MSDELSLNERTSFSDQSSLSEDSSTHDVPTGAASLFIYSKTNSKSDKVEGEAEVEPENDSLKKSKPKAKKEEYLVEEVNDNNFSEKTGSLDNSTLNGRINEFKQTQ
ncbi:MAG: hypothetical protein AAFZ92_00315 [Pseudomonadota bacterium]